MKYVVARNVSAIAKRQGLNSVLLGKKTGTSQPTMNRLMTAREDTQDPRLGTIEAAAQALNVPPWMLFIENIPLSIIEDPRIAENMLKLASCSPRYREKIFEQISDAVRLDDMDRLDREQ